MRAEKRVQVVNPSGLHARPAARLIEVASGLECEVEISNLTNNSEPVDGKSILGVLTLGAECGHEVLIATSGTNAEQGCDLLAHVIANELIEFDEEDVSLK